MDRGNDAVNVYITPRPLFRQRHARSTWPKHARLVYLAAQIRARGHDGGTSGYIVHYGNS
jgi:hypothetical protein